MTSGWLWAPGHLQSSSSVSSQPRPAIMLFLLEVDRSSARLNGHCGQRRVAVVVDAGDQGRARRARCESAWAMPQGIASGRPELRAKTLGYSQGVAEIAIFGAEPNGRNYNAGKGKPLEPLTRQATTRV